MVNHHFNHSPYMVGCSPRMYDSNVRFITVDQSRSRRSPSSSRGSSASDGSEPTFLLRAAEARRIARSPAINRVPRSGQFREGSNGFHLKDKSNSQRQITKKQRTMVASYLPVVMIVIRECSLEESIKAKCLWGSTPRCWSIEKVTKPMLRKNGSHKNHNKQTAIERLTP